MLRPAAGHDVTVHAGSALLVAIDPWADGDWQRVVPGADVTVEVGPRWIAASCSSR